VANGERLFVSEFHTRTVQADDIGGLVRRLAALLKAHPRQDALADRVEFLS
jgi:hypothetical protein